MPRELISSGSPFESEIAYSRAVVRNMSGSNGATV